MAIQISGCNVIDNSRNLTNIANATTAATANTYVLRGADGKICADSVSLPPIRGTSFEGGTLICCSSSVYWIVAPCTSEVSRTWYCRNDANTTAQNVSGCTGWFVPTSSQIGNPGYICKVYWDSGVSTTFWSDTERNTTHAFARRFGNGCCCCFLKDGSRSVRAFRCVSY